jgi:GNAT superfamily N-acetyltransferase
MSELRPHLQREAFVDLVRELEKDGFRLVYISDGEKVVAVAGYRISTSLFMGRHLYIDDLVTASAERSKGYGEQMLCWLRDLAEAEGCNVLHLDSGTHRHEAHKFYFRQGFSIASFHFSQQLHIT